MRQARKDTQMNDAELPFLRSAADKTWDDEAMASVALEYDFDE